MSHSFTTSQGGRFNAAFRRPFLRTTPVVYVYQLPSGGLFTVVPISLMSIVRPLLPDILLYCSVARYCVPATFDPLYRYSVKDPEAELSSVKTPFDKLTVPVPVVTVGRTVLSIRFSTRLAPLNRGTPDATVTSFPSLSKTVAVVVFVRDKPLRSSHELAHRLIGLPCHVLKLDKLDLITIVSIWL